MTAPAHVFGGAAFYYLKKIETRYWQLNMFLYFAMGVVSHFFLDAIRHQEYTLTWDYLVPLVTTETLLSISLVLFVHRGDSLLTKIYIFSSMFGGIVPDAVWVMDRVFHLDWAIINFMGKIHYFFHFGNRYEFVFPPISLVNQTAFGLIAVYFMYRIRNLPPAT